MLLASILGGISVFCLALIWLVSFRSKKAPSTLIAKAEAEDEDFIDRISNKKRISLERRPWSMKYSTYKAIAICSAIIFAVVFYILTQNFLLVLVASGIGFLVPEAIISIKSSSSKADFEARYATSLKQLVAGLKSGLSIHQAVENVCTSPFIHDSVKQEYKLLNADLKLGISIQEAFQSFADRLDCEDARDVAIAIGMQSKVGGREATTIESISKNISDRIMLRKEVKTMFAGSNMTVLAMDAAPFLVVLFMYISVPGYLAPFFESELMLLLFVGLLIFMGVGSVVIHKLINKMKKECGV